MKVRFKYILLFMVLFNVMIFKTSAQTEYLSISATPSTVKVGDTVKVVVHFNSYESGLCFSSDNEKVLSSPSCVEWVQDSSYVTYFTAKSVGKATIYVKTTNGTTMDPNNEQDRDFTRSVKIVVVPNSSGQTNVDSKPSNDNRIDINKTYSKNNYLKSLEIEGYELNPGFNKDTLEYSVTLSPGTEKIKVTGALEDSKASVKGLGEINVTEGVNTINVVVTAENGNERTYKLVVSVEEKDPIDITINNKKYRVIKKREVLGSKNGYDSVDIKINNIQIPALYNEVTGVTLVGLKDEKGTISLFSYDSSTGEYSEYKEFTFDLMNLYVHENKNSKYEKIIIKLNGEDITAYKIPSLDDYYLIYGTNTTTGYEGYYLYDKKENSIQRYDTNLLDKLTGEKNKYLNVVLVLSSVCFLTMLFLLVEVNRDNKREKEIEE